MAHTIKEWEPYKPAPVVSAALYSKKLYSKALRCGIVYPEKRIKSWFDEALGESICENMRVILKKHPYAPMTEPTRYPDRLTKIADGSLKTGESSKYKPIRSASRPNRSKARAAMTSGND